MNAKQKIRALSFGIRAATTLHGSVTDAEHAASAHICKCEYGRAIRGMALIRDDMRALLRAKAGRAPKPDEVYDFSDIVTEEL
jgi:hypothetical protein